jgi:hypothetical protein
MFPSPTDRSKPLLSSQSRDIKIIHIVCSAHSCSIAAANIRQPTDVTPTSNLRRDHITLVQRRIVPPYPPQRMTSDPSVKNTCEVVIPVESRRKGSWVGDASHARP